MGFLELNGCVKRSTVSRRAEIETQRSLLLDIGLPIDLHTSSCQTIDHLDLPNPRDHTNMDPLTTRLRTYLNPQAILPASTLTPPRLKKFDCSWTMIGVGLTNSPLKCDLFDHRSSIDVVNAVVNAE